MSPTKSFLSLCALALLLVPVASGAAIINLAANMDCSQANNGAGTCGLGGTGTGTAVITLDDVTNQLSWTVTYSGLSGTPTLAHFHGPALPNAGAGVQVGIGLANPAIGNAILTDQQEADILAGLWYVNIHTSTFGNGEIRGQVFVVPEPGTLAVVGLGLGALGLAHRLRRR